MTSRKANMLNSGLRFVGVLAVVLSVWCGRALACESCAVFSATNLREGKDNSWSAAVSEQYTDYKLAGAGVSNELLRDGELLKSYSTTQLDLSYDITSSFGTQLSIPFIVREFDTVKAFRKDSDSETGIGDAAFLFDYSPYSKREIDYAIHTTVYAGLKFPTGDTGSLEEQINPGVESERLGVKHHQGGGIPGLQGRVLSLGTGSWDTFYGFGALGRWKRSMFIVTGEYTQRTEGDFDYRFANDFLWSAGPAYFLVLEDELTVALQGLFSGEHKDKDVHDGVEVGGTSVANLYVGPSLLLTSGDRLAGELSFQLPFYTDDPGAVVVPEYRIRAALSYLF